MIDWFAISGLREQWKILPGTVSQAIGLEMVDTIEALYKVARAAEKHMQSSHAGWNQELLDALAALKEPRGKGE